MGAGPVGLVCRALLLGLLAAGPAPAAAGAPAARPEHPGWSSDARTGCRVWNGDPQPDESVIWSGACPGGVAQGPGVLEWRWAAWTWRSGPVAYPVAAGWARYAGSLRDGRREGPGSLDFADGGRFEGGFQNGQPAGPGRFRRPDGTWREGNWAQGCLLLHPGLRNNQLCLGGPHLR